LFLELPPFCDIRKYLLRMQEERGVMPIRPLEKQFEPKKVAEIKKLQKEYENLRLTLKGGSAGYMISGITRSLETGILIGALSLAFSFLYMFVHDLLIVHYREEDLDGDNPRDMGPVRFSGQSILPFEGYIHKFRLDHLIEEKEAKEILLLYRNIGIPLHHVLSRRIGRYGSPLIIGQDNLLDRFLTRNIGDLHQIEEMIEDYATECLQKIVSFIQKHQGVIKNRG